MHDDIRKAIGRAWEGLSEETREKCNSSWVDMSPRISRRLTWEETCAIFQSISNPPTVEDYICRIPERSKTDES